MTYEEKEELEYRIQKVVDYLQHLGLSADEDEEEDSTEDNKRHVVWMLVGAEISKVDEGYVCDRVSKMNITDGAHVATAHLLAELLTSQIKEGEDNSTALKFLDLVSTLVKEEWKAEEYEEEF